MHRLPSNLVLLTSVVFTLNATPVARQGLERPRDVVSAPEFEVTVARDVMIPMRDGVTLATDLYFPAENGEQLPGQWSIVLERTPYNKQGQRLVDQAEFFAARGYVSAVQDIRGRYASEGSFLMYGQEGNDGMDTVEWLADQPWSNDQIGLTGGSYTAATAHSILTQGPSAVSAAFIREGSANYHEDGAWQGGAFELAHNLGYALSLGSVGKEAAASSSVADALRWAQNNFAQQLQMAPLRPGSNVLALAPSYAAWYTDWQTHDRYDDYWKQNGYDVEQRYDQVADVPVLLLGAWYDRFNRGSLNNFLGYTQHNDSPVHLYAIPAVHGPGNVEVNYAGDVDFGPEAAIFDAPKGSTRMMELNLQWFDRWLKGLDNGVRDADLVRLFRMEPRDGKRNADGRLQAGGTWQEFDIWPPANVRFTDFYLTSDLGLQTEISSAGSITFEYDPANPVPTVGGSMTSGGDAAPEGAYDQRCRESLPLCTNTLPLHVRPDVLSFETPPLTETVEVTGPIAVHLWISSTAIDTDFTAKLVDVYPPTPDYPDGYAMNLVDSIVRARFRTFEQKGPHYHRAYGISEELLEPGKVYEVTIDLVGTSALFPPGHRIRLDISSSNFPRFDVNPNTAETYLDRKLPPIKAHNSVHMGGANPSRMVLPIRPVM